MMIFVNRIIDRIGNKKPLFFSEFKGQLTRRNIKIASATSFLIQSLMFLYFNMMLPPRNTTTSDYFIGSGVLEKRTGGFNKYCDGEQIDGKNLNWFDNDAYSQWLCTLDSAGDFNIKWNEWWAGIHSNLGWIIFTALTLVYIYILIANLYEKRRGITNNTHLSPRAQQQIFIGKTLGTLVLVHLTVALMIPLHLITGINAGISLVSIASSSVTIGLFYLCFSIVTMIYAAVS